MSTSSLAITARQSADPSATPRRDAVSRAAASAAYRPGDVRPRLGPPFRAVMSPTPAPMMATL